MTYNWANEVIREVKSRVGQWNANGTITAATAYYANWSGTCDGYNVIIQPSYAPRIAGRRPGTTAVVITTAPFSYR